MAVSNLKNGENDVNNASNEKQQDGDGPNETNEIHQNAAPGLGPGDARADNINHNVEMMEYGQRDTLAQMRGVHDNISLKAWLADCGMSEYFDLFQESGFEDDLLALVEVDEDDLKELGIEIMAHRKIILKALNELKEHDHEMNGEEEKSDSETQNSLWDPVDPHHQFNDHNQETAGNTAGGGNDGYQRDDGEAVDAPSNGEFVSKCTDCGKEEIGKIYEEENLFYCLECWKCYDHDGDDGEGDNQTKI